MSGITNAERERLIELGFELDKKGHVAARDQDGSGIRHAIEEESLGDPDSAGIDVIVDMIVPGEPAGYPIEIIHLRFPSATDSSRRSSTSTRTPPSGTTRRTAP